MAIITGAGTKLAVSVDTPTTEDEAGYAALTFTEIGHIERIGSFGSSTEVTTFTPLRGPVQKLKGSTNYGALQPSMAFDDEDAGQAILQILSADDYNDQAAFEVTYVNGAIRYFSGLVFGFPEDTSGAGNVVMANPGIEINTKIVKVGA